MSPTSRRILIPVLTPTPGIDVRIGPKGCDWSASSNCVSRSDRASMFVNSYVASTFKIWSAARLPGMITDCSASEVVMRSRIFWCARGACLVINECSERLLVVESPTGPPNFANTDVDGHRKLPNGGHLWRILWPWFLPAYGQIVPHLL